MGNYKLASENITYEKFDDEIVILDLQNGKYFSLSKSASIIFDNFLNGASLDDIKYACRSNPNVKFENVSEFLEIAISNKILSPCDADGKFILSEADKISFASVSDEPTLDVYDDLADLFMADPIHEVEENVGWPLRKQDA